MWSTEEIFHKGEVARSASVPQSLLLSQGGRRHGKKVEGGEKIKMLC